jgi:hypothetical protein
LIVANLSFLTDHARVLMCIAHDPGARLRDIAASLCPSRTLLRHLDESVLRL